ncbi:MAG: peptide chain release factor N(5)-glutamine methyltransferase [Clostridia bacterium]|nr:peptide chain release factor N(5)-glutamine methyltransferase [Clostridia bacterium]
MAYSYRTLTDTLSRGGIDEPSLEASLLLERFVGISHAILMTERDRLFDSPELEAAITRRFSREPLQYILGEWEFMGCPFTVSPDCLIPRPDTEILVETAIRTLHRNAHVVDLCTGSGCIAVSTLVHRPDVTADALELYPKTLALATENATRNGVSDRFTPIRADLLDGGVSALTPLAPYDAILSNPPYIPTAVVAGLSPEVHREPVAALDGGEDGLTFYRAILKDYAPMVKPGGYILLEMGYDQADALRELAAEYLPYATLEILRDLGGNDRVTMITLPDA